jgi:hypothetical protein
LPTIEAEYRAKKLAISLRNTQGGERAQTVPKLAAVQARAVEVKAKAKVPARQREKKKPGPVHPTQSRSSARIATAKRAGSAIQMVDKKNQANDLGGEVAKKPAPSPLTIRLPANNRTKVKTEASSPENAKGGRAIETFSHSKFTFVNVGN